MSRWWGCSISVIHRNNRNPKALCWLIKYWVEFKTLSCWNFHEDDCLLHALPIYHVHGLFVALGCPAIIWFKGAMDGIRFRKVIQALSKCTVMIKATYYTRLLSSENLNKDNTFKYRLLICSPPLLEDTFHELNQEQVKRYWKGTVWQKPIQLVQTIKGKRKPVV